MKKKDFSKQLVSDIRWLLWVVTVGAILLAFYCIYRGYTGSLPWVASMVGYDKMIQLVKQIETVTPKAAEPENEADRKEV